MILLPKKHIGHVGKFLPPTAHQKHPAVDLSHLPSRSLEQSVGDLGIQGSWEIVRFFPQILSFYFSLVHIQDLFFHRGFFQVL